MSAHTPGPCPECLSQSGIYANQLRPCPLHAAAPDLFAVLLDGAARWDAYDEKDNPALGVRIRAALEKAQPPPVSPPVSL